MGTSPSAAPASSACAVEGTVVVLKGQRRELLRMGMGRRRMRRRLPAIGLRR